MLVILLLCGCAHSQACQQYNVSVSCHNQPCFTLSEYATALNDSLGSCIQFNLQPGNHSLSYPAELSFENIQSVIFGINSSDAHTTITCISGENATRLDFKNVSQVYIHGITVIGCEVYASDVENFTVENCTFTGDNFSGSAFFLTDTSIDISHCVFTKLQGSSYGNYTSVGGAVVCIDSTISMYDSMVDSNQGQVGGAIFANSGCNISLLNSSFVNNYAEEGGAVVFSTVDSFTVEGELMIRDCDFTGNSARNGGVLHIKFQSRVFIENSSFHDNQGVSGGVLYLNHSQVHISSTNFTNNSAQIGGSVYVHNGNVNINASNFINNKAYILGGALYTTEMANTDIYDSYFAHNEAERAGGVIAANSSTSTGIYNSTFELNLSKYIGGVIHATYNQTIHIHGSSFLNNTAQQSGGAIVYAFNATADISDSAFMNNVAHYAAGVLYAIDGTHTTIYNSSFVNNSAGDDGGALLFYKDQTVFIHGSRFTHNKCDDSGGAVSCSYSAKTEIHDSHFSDNLATFAGGALFTGDDAQTDVYNSQFTDNTADFAGGAFAGYFDQTIRIYNTSFTNNTAQDCGGALDCSFNVSAEIYDSTFTGNVGGDGGAVFALVTNMNINNVVFVNNSVSFTGGALSAYHTNSDIHSSFFQGNTATYAGGALNVYYNKVTFINASHFENNTAHNRGGVIHCAYNTSIDIYDSTFTYNTAPRGGAIFAFDYAYKGIYDSNQFVNFSGVTVINNNLATKNGGAILTVESTINVNDQLIVENNTALNTGGGLYLHQSQMGVRGNCIITGNQAVFSGGGVFSLSSSIAVQGKEELNSSLTFYRNEARLGGGLLLVLNSKLYVVFLSLAARTFNFIENTAEYGAAIYAVDEANQETCVGDVYSPIPTSSRACFFQSIELLQDEFDVVSQDVLKISFNFTNNDAQFSGSDLFGGLLDRCTVRFVRRSQQDEDDTPNAGFSLLSTMSNINFNNLTLKSISSSPIKIYLCTNDTPEYTLNSPEIQVEQGESFNISVVAVDQVYHPLNATIVASLSSASSGLREGQHSHDIGAECTNLTFTVTAPNSIKEDKIVLYAKGPCGDAERYVREVRINFSRCQCPVGFQRDSTQPNTCECTCHKNITELVDNCDSTTLSFTRRQNSWISYVNTSKNSSELPYYLLVHEHCPYDYCISAFQQQQNEIDKQCALNRTGVLCGKCLPGLTVSIGSSNCLKCTNGWPALLILVLLVALVAGFALIFLIMFLNITVATGTINGVIFYANIIAANRSVMIRLPSPSFPSVFISWINLDIGFDTCLYDGMDSYAKVWLHMALPMYLILLTVAVIFVSKYSERFSNLIGKRHPVATLATLILLSYAKLLSAIIAIMSNTQLMYPDGPRTLWLPDANIVFLKDPRHIVLFLVGMVILVLVAGYTSVLLLWQLIIRLPNWRVFGWTRFPRLISFMETYHAPYKSKYRYWTGLLLLVRVVLSLVSALNTSGDPKVPLVATVITTGFLIVLDKDRCINSIVGVMESLVYINILTLAALSWYTVDSSGCKHLQAAAIHISTFIVFVQLILIIFYHAWKYTKLHSLIHNTMIYKRLQRMLLTMKANPKERCDSISSTHLQNVNRDVDIFEMIDYIPDAQVIEPQSGSTGVSTSSVTITDVVKQKDEEHVLQRHRDNGAAK